MGEVRKPLPVQLIAGLIVNPAEGFGRVRAEVERAWGAVELESPVWEFVWTDYYEKEMGKGLLRQFVVFEGLRDIEGLFATKLAANDVEARVASGSKADVARPANIDPGYICQSKLVLFSTKDFSHRLYVGKGVFAESTLEWRGGEFTIHPWTFPDYRSEQYRNFLARARGLYAEKLKRIKA